MKGAKRQEAGCNDLGVSSLAVPCCLQLLRSIYEFGLAVLWRL